MQTASVSASSLVEMFSAPSMDWPRGEPRSTLVMQGLESDSGQGQVLLLPCEPPASFPSDL